ncbi:MAG: hypothetical protein ACFFEK_04790 [Candidatus Thorarchaeota archaeon]
MSKLEAVSSKQLVLVDSYDARKNHILVLAFALLIGIVYAMFLWLVCSTTPGLVSALLLFGSQIAIGFPAARAYYDLGVSHRENLHFIDPSKFNEVGKKHEVEINLGEIPLIFEKIGIQIQKYDKGSSDDLSDLVWFGIFVWASISSASFYLRVSGNFLWSVGALILFVACTGSYVSGYSIKHRIKFEDDLNHLQYYVEKHLKTIDAILPNNGTRHFVQILERWRVMVLIDFISRIKIGESGTLEYHMGFPSSRTECILIKAPDDIISKLNNKLQSIHFIKIGDWTVQQSELNLRVTNIKTDFSVSNRSSFVASPSIVDDKSRITADIISKIYSLLV